MSSRWIVWILAGGWAGCAWRPLSGPLPLAATVCSSGGCVAASAGGFVGYGEAWGNGALRGEEAIRRLRIQTEYGGAALTGGPVSLGVEATVGIPMDASWPLRSSPGDPSRVGGATFSVAVAGSIWPVLVLIPSGGYALKLFGSPVCDRDTLTLEGGMVIGFPGWIPSWEIVGYRFAGGGALILRWTPHGVRRTVRWVRAAMLMFARDSQGWSVAAGLQWSGMRSRGRRTLR